jgi:hypothetical protein
MLSLIKDHTKKKAHPQTLDNIVCGHFREYSRETMELAFNQQQQIMFHQQQYYKSYGSGGSPHSPSTNTVSNTSSGDYSFSTLNTIGVKGPVNNNVIKTFSWRKTESFDWYQRLRNEQPKSTPREQYLSENGFDVLKEIDQLRQSASQVAPLREGDLITTYQKFIKYITTREQLIEFLSFLPESRGGLYPVVVSIFHSSLAVRLLVVTFCQRLESIEEGELFMRQLNLFLIMAYTRNAESLKSFTTDDV